MVLASLPTAQNVFNYAQRYDVGETIARDTIFLTHDRLHPRAAARFRALIVM